MKMRVFDLNNNELASVDYSLGKLLADKLFIAHHDAVEAVEEVWHYEYTDYPNGGRDRYKVIDVEGVAAQDAWDEYEDIYRFIPYTEEELAELEAERNKPTLEEQVAELREALTLLLEGAT